MSVTLCFRCERRAVFMETGRAPRLECRNTGQSVYGCYCYEPVHPVVLAKDDGDTRGIDWPEMLRAWSHGVGVATGECIVRDAPGGYAIYYEGGNHDTDSCRRAAASRGDGRERRGGRAAGRRSGKR